MAKEIERKFLVADLERARAAAESSCRLTQAYLWSDGRGVVRVRIAGPRAYLTIKGRNDGIVRDEWEYEIPVEDAREMIERLADTSSVVIDKTRMIAGDWEIDEYHGALAGLVMAEIELPSPDCHVEFPSWLGREVSGDARYYNSELARRGLPDDN